jgi:tetratricopeptide (TPR) repeat protein
LAHRTRKKLTKKEIKRDPVREKLEAGLLYIQGHYREFIGGIFAIIVFLFVMQYIAGKRNTSNDESMAGFITSSQVFSQAQAAAEANQAEQAFQAMGAAYTMAMQTWNNNPQNEWARKAAILAAKIDIIRGEFDTALTTLTAVLAANPEESIKIPALLHMGILLENRGSEQDLVNALSSYQEILDNADDGSIAEAQALQGLSRVYYAQGNYGESGNYLSQALAMSEDTTAFEAYQITRLSALTN